MDPPHHSLEHHDHVRPLARRRDQPRVGGVHALRPAGQRRVAGPTELHVPVAAFGTDTLSAGGYVRITEYAVRYHVQFDVADAAGNVLVPQQRIDMSREYSYDASNTVGNASQVEEIQRSLNDDMVQAILFRLQAASKHELAAPAAASSTH